MGIPREYLNSPHFKKTFVGRRRRREERRKEEGKVLGHFA
jgi:hypothetical protein